MSSRRSVKHAKPKEESEVEANRTVREFLTVRLGCVESTTCCSFLFEDKIKSLQGYLRRVAEGESNSVLLIGPRGTGKTQTFDTSYSRLNESEPGIPSKIVVVTLNGYLQTDDKSALKEISRQLKLDADFNEEELETTSYADCFSGLLKKGRTSKSFVFLIEEIDLFASHHNQILLYTLLDATQSKDPAALVVGVTCRLDFLDLLEKRVKSRFSHRQMYFLNSWSEAEYLSCCEKFLEIPPGIVSQKATKSWNNNIKNLVYDDKTLGIVKDLYCLSKKLGDLKTLLAVAISFLSEAKPNLSPEDLQSAHEMLAFPSTTGMFLGLTVLELCILIAMKNLSEKFEDEPINFEATFTEFSNFTSKKCSQLQFPKSVLLKSLEHLMALEFIRPQRSFGSQIGPKEFQHLQLDFDPDLVTDIVKTFPNCPSAVKQWSEGGFTV